jgi:hypothetical protein
LIAQRLKNHPADAAESVNSYFDCHSLYLLFLGGIQFRKPMGYFNRQRPPVNAELGGGLAKSSPFLAGRRRNFIRPPRPQRVSMTALGGGHGLESGLNLGMVPFGSKSVLKPCHVALE